MAKRKRQSTKRKSTKSGRWRKLVARWRGPALRFGIRLGVVGILAVAGLTVWLDLKVRADFEGKRWSVPARLYEIGRAHV